MYRFLSLGVDNIITDEVSQATTLRDEFVAMSPVERIIIGFRYHLSR